MKQGCKAMMLHPDVSQMSTHTYFPYKEQQVKLCFMPLSYFSLDTLGP